MGSLLSAPAKEEHGFQPDSETLMHINDGLLHNSGGEMVATPIVSDSAKKSIAFPKVELHLHVDGAIRFTTLLELSEKRGIPMKDAKTVDELKKILVTHTPADLARVLEAFQIFLPVVKNDLEAVERIAYELCEDQAKNGVVYFEGRYAPHFLFDNTTTIKPEDVIAAVKRGFDRGEKDFGVKARSIVCAIRGESEFVRDILRLATDFKHLGVVAVDVAGSAHGADEQYEQEVVDMFKEAARRGIHRTCHAGESGTPKEVEKAITVMETERIGHGYRVMRDMVMYKRHFIDDKHIHLEACPYSSVMTGSVPLDWKNHPIATWASDDVNFSISRDDPTCFDNTMSSELLLVKQSIGLTKHQLWKCQLNGARSCFLPEEEKQELVQLILNSEPKEE